MSAISQAREAGYSDEEILEFFKTKDPEKYEKIQAASSQGYPLEEIFEYIESTPDKIEAEEVEEKPSFAQRLASSPPGQFVLGSLKKLSWPLDLLQAAGLGEGLSSVDEIEEIAQREGVPFDREDYLSKVYQAASVMPTQELAEAYIKQTTGLDLAPKDKKGRISRTGGEIFGLQGKNLLTEGPKRLIKKGLAAGTGGVVAENLKELGVPELFADIAGHGTAGAAEAARKAKPKLSPEGLKATETAEKYNLPKFAGMEAEKAPKKPVVPKEKQIRLKKELSDSTKQAIDSIIEGEVPIKKLKDRGYDLEGAYQSLYKEAETQAKKFDKKGGNIDVQPVLNFIKKEMKEIKESAPSLSKPDKVRMNILKEEYKALTQEPPKVKEPKVKLLGPRGEPLPSKAPQKGRIPKKVSAAQAIDQKRNWNENVKDLYRKAEFTGAENEVRATYAQLNKELMEAIEKSGDKELAQSLKFGDRIYSEVQKLNQVNEILDQAFEKGYDPKKMNRILKNKRLRSYLKRNLGSKAVPELKAIADYGERAHEKVLSKLKTPTTVGDWLKELTPLKASLLFLKGTVGIPAIPFMVGKAGLNRLQGWLFTRNATRKAYEGFLKGAATGQIGAFKKASERLSKAIIEEFGSEEELLDLIKKGAPDEKKKSS